MTTTKKYSHEALRATADNLLEELQSKFKNSVVTIKVGRIESEHSSIHFDASVHDEFVNDGWINYTDKYTEAIKSVLESKGLKVNFNNTKSIFWIYL